MVFAQCLFLLFTTWKGAAATKDSGNEVRAPRVPNQRTAVGVYMLIFICCLPGLIYGSQQAATATATIERVFVWRQISNDFFFSFFGTFARQWSVDIAVSFVFTVALFAALACAMFHRNPGIRYFAFNSLIPMILMLAYSLMYGRLLIHTRYLIFPVTACVGLFALLLSSLPEKPMFVGILVTANFGIFGVFKSWDSIGPGAESGMRAATRDILETRDRESEVYCAGPVEYFRLCYYLRRHQPPRLLVNDVAGRFWGKRYVRSGRALAVRNFASHRKSGDWFVTETHRLSVRIDSEIQSFSDPVASFRQEFRWGKPVRLRRFTEPDDATTRSPSD